MGPADHVDGAGARRSGRSDASGRREDLAPGAGGEVEFVKVVDAVLAVVAAEDVEGVAEDGGGVEGALAGRAARGGGVGFDDGPSFLVGHFVVVVVVDVEEEIVVVAMLGIGWKRCRVIGKPLLLLLIVRIGTGIVVAVVVAVVA